MPLWPVWSASLCAYSYSSAPSFSVWAITGGAKLWPDTTHHFQGVRKLKWMNSLLTPTFILGTCFLNWIWPSLVPGCAGSAGWCCLSCPSSRSTSTTRRKPSSPAWTVSGSDYCRVLGTGIPWCSEPCCGYLLGFAERVCRREATVSTKTLCSVIEFITQIIVWPSAHTVLNFAML